MVSLSSEEAVHLTRLVVDQFRNLQPAAYPIPANGAIFLGDNGQGKSNLLEAIYYLGLFRSFRGSRDEELVAFGAQYFRLVGQISREDGTSFEVAAAYDGRGKRVSVEGKEVGRLSGVVGLFAVVLLAPQDIALIQASPAHRRRFLDLLLSVSSPRYLAALTRYREVLAQRNRLLRLGETREANLEAWDEPLAEYGAELIGARLALLEELAEDFHQIYAHLAARATVTVAYRTTVPVGAPATVSRTPLVRELAGEIPELRRALRRTLSRRRSEELRLQTTLAGPHRDDLLFQMEGRDLRIFGSQGEQRLAAIALRLAEGRYLRRRSEVPVYLLDDLFAELDEARCERVLDLILGEGQVLLATPKLGGWGARLSPFGRYWVEAGRVTPDGGGRLG